MDKEDFLKEIEKIFIDRDFMLVTELGEWLDDIHEDARNWFWDVYADDVFSEVLKEWIYLGALPLHEQQFQKVGESKAFEWKKAFVGGYQWKNQYG